MKKLLIVAVLFLSISATSFAANNEVSSEALAHLEATYTDAKDVAWTVTDEFAKASFTNGNEKLNVYYNTDGAIIGSFKTFAFDKLPKAALETLTSEYTYPVYQLKDCTEFTDADNNKSYYVSFTIKNENIFLSISANGFISKVKAN